MYAPALGRRAVKLGALSMGAGARLKAGDLVVLLYHRICRLAREIDVPEAIFRRHMQILGRCGRVRSLDDALADGSPGGLVVTIDDGYRDFYSTVLPIAVEHRVPVVLYLATGLVDGGRDADRLTWSQLADALSTGLVTVGAHTHSHADLSRADTRIAEREMKKSKELIEDHLGTACRHFAYPWAVGSPAAESVARTLFDTSAVRWCTNRQGRIDPHRLGRTPILRSDGTLFFRTKVNGMLDKEALAYRALRRGPWRDGPERRE
jgi:hypothetical protein